MRGGRLFIPVDRLQIVAHELFVKAWRIGAFLVTGNGPEPGRIRSKAFINKHQLVVDRSELELGFGYDDASGVGKVATLSEERETDVANLRGQSRAYQLSKLAPGNGFVVTGVCLSRGSKQDFGEARGEFQTGWQRFPIHFSGCLILFPGRSGQVPANDAFHGQRSRFTD